MWKSFDRGFTPFMDGEQKVEDWGDCLLSSGNSDLIFRLPSSVRVHSTKIKTTGKTVEL